MSCINASPRPEPGGLTGALRAAIAAQPASDRPIMLECLAEELRRLQDDLEPCSEALRVLRMAQDAVAEARATRH